MKALRTSSTFRGRNINNNNRKSESVEPLVEAVECRVRPSTSKGKSTNLHTSIAVNGKNANTQQRPRSRSPFFRRKKASELIDEVRQVENALNHPGLTTVDNNRASEPRLRSVSPFSRRKTAQELIHDIRQTNSTASDDNHQQQHIKFKVPPSPAATRSTAASTITPGGSPQKPRRRSLSPFRRRKKASELVADIKEKEKQFHADLLKQTQAELKKDRSSTSKRDTNRKSVKDKVAMKYFSKQTGYSDCSVVELKLSNSPDRESSSTSNHRRGFFLGKVPESPTSTPDSSPRLTKDSTSRRKSFRSSSNNDKNAAVTTPDNEYIDAAEQSKVKQAALNNLAGKVANPLVRTFSLLRNKEENKQEKELEIGIEGTSPPPSSIDFATHRSSVPRVVSELSIHSSDDNDNSSDENTLDLRSAEAIRTSLRKVERELSKAKKSKKKVSKDVVVETLIEVADNLGYDTDEQARLRQEIFRLGEKKKKKQRSSNGDFSGDEDDDDSCWSDDSEATDETSFTQWLQGRSRDNEVAPPGNSFFDVVGGLIWGNDDEFLDDDDTTQSGNEHRESREDDVNAANKRTTNPLSKLFSLPTATTSSSRDVFDKQTQRDEEMKRLREQLEIEKQRQKEIAKEEAMIREMEEADRKIREEIERKEKEALARKIEAERKAKIAEQERLRKIADAERERRKKVEMELQRREIAERQELQRREVAERQELARIKLIAEQARRRKQAEEEKLKRQAEEVRRQNVQQDEHDLRGGIKLSRSSSMGGFFGKVRSRPLWQQEQNIVQRIRLNGAALADDNNEILSVGSIDSDQFAHSPFCDRPSFEDEMGLSEEDDDEVGPKQRVDPEGMKLRSQSINKGQQRNATIRGRNMSRHKSRLLV